MVHMVYVTVTHFRLSAGASRGPVNGPIPLRGKFHFPLDQGTVFPSELVITWYTRYMVQSVPADHCACVRLSCYQTTVKARL